MSNQEHWGSNFGFIMAAAGSAVGLGNIWKFPYMVGMNGGGAFVLIYIVSICLVGLPVMLAEFSLGRASQSDPIGAFKYFSLKSSVFPKILAGYGAGLGTALIFFGHVGLGVIVLLAALFFFKFSWAQTGFLCVLGAGVILSAYAIIGGWIIYYTYLAFTRELVSTDPNVAATQFATLAKNGWLCAGMGILFLCLCCGVCIMGVKKGIEAVSKVIMPLLLLLLLVLVIRALTLPGAGKGVSFYLAPDFGKIRTGGVLEALGHAFYSLSLGMAILITYGSYLPRNKNLLSSVCIIALLDTLVALLAGLAIFPAVFAMNMSPAQGPSLIFQVLPVTFNTIPGNLGFLWNGIFFLLLFIGAFTSGISLMEAVSSSFIHQLKFKRSSAVITVTVLTATLTFILSFGIISWENFRWLETVLKVILGNIKSSLFDEVDYICSSWILPLNGLAIALFTGWIWGVRKAARELYRTKDGKMLESFTALENTRKFLGLKIPVTVWSFFIRYIAPALVLITFLYAAGFFSRFLNK